MPWDKASGHGNFLIEGCKTQDLYIYIYAKRFIKYQVVLQNECFSPFFG